MIELIWRYRFTATWVGYVGYCVVVLRVTEAMR